MSSRDVERGGKNRGNNSYFYDESSGDTQWTSWLIPAIVVANVGVFIAVMFVNDCPKTVSGGRGNCVAGFLGRLSFQPLRENPLFGPSSSTLEKMGALEWRKVVKEHQGWRLITCMWLHAGVIHLLTNMLSLVFIGIRLEQQFGFIRVGMIYLMSGLGGSVLSSLFLQQSISVGASGALFGLLGAMLSELLTNWTIYANKAAALLTLVFIIAVNLALGMLPRVDNFAHIGGFLTGFLLGFVLLVRPQFGWEESRVASYGVRTKPKYNACQYGLFITAALLLVLGLTVGLVMLFKGENGNKHCKWCHYLSCVPTSKWTC
ncbi:PREDICTED: RHOMBOID-like protein 2 [Tarenaya hassleriana]|uniref:RHOMBOID-like protein 2 n=1 Tax=Tarenaya hassleriana TaxID=28532 RepID=UPI00053C27D9|nr:PREDICTED: RHOMBOID-like protein 2 [Tarenaya hassleriana]